MKEIILHNFLSDAEAFEQTIQHLNNNETVCIFQKNLRIIKHDFFKEILKDAFKYQDWQCVCFPVMSIKKDEWDRDIEPLRPRKVSKYFCQLYDQMDDFFCLVFRPQSIDLCKKILYSLQMGPYKTIIQSLEKEIVWCCTLDIFVLRNEYMFSHSYLAWNQDIMLTTEYKENIIKIFRQYNDLNTNEYFKRISW